MGFSNLFTRPPARYHIRSCAKWERPASISMSLPTRAVVQSILDFDGFECVLTDENHVYSIKYQLELLQKGEKLEANSKTLRA